MRQFVQQKPEIGDVRVIKRFLIFPQTLELKNGGLQRRFFEMAEIVQEYNEVVYPGQYGFEKDEMWIDVYWKEDYFGLESYKEKKSEHHFY